MKNHIVLHHAIVQSWAIDHGFSILPNSPEGDAFVMYKKASPSAEQRERVKRTMLAYAENLQHRFTMCRETTASGAPGALLIPGAEKLPDFKGLDGKPKQPGIYIRVGVASGKVFNIDNWKSYFYDVSSFTKKCPRAQSYRGKIVDLSEKMEMASDVNGYSYIDVDAKPVDATKPLKGAEHKTAEECAYFARSLEPTFRTRTDVIFTELQSTMIEQKKPAVVAFIHGTCEFNAQDALCETIKVKRDNTTMMVFYPDDARRRGRSAKNESLGQTALHRALRVLRPGSGCHIGLSFGDVNVTSIRFAYAGQHWGQCPTKDVFGDVVNLAARASGAGIDLDNGGHGPFSDGDYRHYLRDNECRFVLLVPAAANKSTTDVHGLTKTELVEVIKKGDRRTKHASLHTGCQMVTTQAKKKKGKKECHAITRFEINVGTAKEQLFQWWW